MKTSAIAGFVLLAFATSAWAQPEPAPSLERCTTLSFDPLGVNVPDCAALLESGALDGLALAAVLAARANAYEFALTYHYGRKVAPDALLAAARADLDRAVALDPRHHGQRAGILFQQRRFEEAAAGYTVFMEAAPEHASGALQFRSIAREAGGDIKGAIDDMSAAIRLAAAARERAPLLARRAQLREAAGDRAGAAADDTAVLRLAPDHPAAGAELARLRSRLTTGAPLVR